MTTKADLQEVGPLRSSLTILFCIASSILIFSTYIHMSGKTDGYISENLSTWYFLFPDKLYQEIEFGGFKGTLIITIVKSFNILLYCSIAALLGYSVTKAYRNRGRAALEAVAEEKRIFKPKDEYTSPTDKTHSKVLVQGLVATEYNQPEPINLSRATLKVKSEPKNDLERLEFAVMAILAKYRAVPSDTEGAHHGDTPIFEHTISVTKAIQKALPDERLSKIIGLAHDIGKILAYKKNDKPNGREWVTVTNKHEQLSAQVIRMLPEYEALKVSDQESATIINAVLTYSPIPEKLPNDLSQPRILRLIKQLKIADGFTVRAEQKTATEQSNSEDVVSAVSDCIINILVSLNINSYIKAAYADGWTNPAYDFVGVLDESIRRNLKGMLHQKVADKICLHMPYERGKRHPATATIIQALKLKGLLLEEHGGIESNNGLFAIKASSQKFYGVYLLDRDKLQELIPEQLETWGKSQYSIKVIGHSDEKLRPSRNDSNKDEEI